MPSSAPSEAGLRPLHRASALLCQTKLFYTPVLLPHDKDEHGYRFLKYAVLTSTAAAVHLLSWYLPYFLLLPEFLPGRSALFQSPEGSLPPAVPEQLRILPDHAPESLEFLPFQLWDKAWRHNSSLNCHQAASRSLQFQNPLEKIHDLWAGETQMLLSPFCLCSCHLLFGKASDFPCFFRLCTVSTTPCAVPQSHAHPQHWSLPHPHFPETFPLQIP